MLKTVKSRERERERERERNEIIQVGHFLHWQYLKKFDFFLNAKTVEFIRESINL